MKINILQGDLTDISAKKEALATMSSGQRNFEARVVATMTLSGLILSGRDEAIYC